MGPVKLIKNQHKPQNGDVSPEFIKTNTPLNSLRLHPNDRLSGLFVVPEIKVATNQAMPMPRKTLTALDPVTFPIELSALSSWKLKRHFEYWPEYQTLKKDIY